MNALLGVQRQLRLNNRWETVRRCSYLFETKLLMISIFLLLIRLDEGDHWGCFYSRSANVGAEAWRAETLLKATRKESGRKKNPTHRVCSHPPGLSLWPVPPLSPGAWTCSSFDKGPWAFQSSKEVASAPAVGLGQRRAQHYPMPESESARGLRGHGTRCPHRRGPGNKSCAERNESEINRIVSNPEILQKASLFLSTEINSSLFEDLGAGEH